MTKGLVAAGAINAAIAVAAGAFAAHGLRGRLDARALEVFETGARYQMYHALAILLCAAFAMSGARTAGWIFQAGIVVFSGSLYVLALTDVKILGAITPLGGLAFLAGWVWLAVSALRASRARFDIPVVYLTAHSDAATIERANRTEPYGYLTKPVNTAELRSVIEVAIFKHDLEKRLRARERWLATTVEQQQQAGLADRLASLGTMAAGISHEINNPLAVVIANASFVLDELRDLQERRGGNTEDLAAATQAQAELDLAARRIALIVGKLQMFSRPVQLVAGESDVDVAIAWALQSAELHLARAITEVPRVKIDQTRLGHVLANLLSNAVAALEPRSVDDQSLAIDARSHDASVVIEVRDTGRGIVTLLEAGASSARARRFG